MDAKNEKLVLFALSLRSVYLVARLARQWMQRNEKLLSFARSLGSYIRGSFGSEVTTEPNEPPNITVFKSGPVFYSLAQICDRDPIKITVRYSLVGLRDRIKSSSSNSTKISFLRICLLMLLYIDSKSKL